MRRAAPLLAALALAACGGGDDETAATAPTPTRNANPAAGPGVTVAIQDNDFQPETITIAKGETVTWRNDGQTDHTVAGKGMTNSPASAAIPPGTTYTWTAEKVGTMRYQCTIHPQMTGEVVVTRPGAA